MNCPNCESSNTKSFSMIYDLYSSDYGSQMAKKCRPPDEPNLGLFFGIVFLVLSVLAALNIAKFNFFGSYWIVFLMTLAICYRALIVVWDIAIGKARFAAYDKNLVKWQESWLCMQCNNEFLKKRANSSFHQTLRDKAAHRRRIQTLGVTTKGVGA